MTLLDNWSALDTLTGRLDHAWTQPDKRDNGVDTMDTDDRTVSVSEAAAALSISTDAVRKRLDRGTLQGVKVSGRWQITLPDDVLDTATPPTGNQPDALVQELRDTIDDLRRRLDDATDKHATDGARVDALIADLRNERERADTLRAMNMQLLALQPGDPPENEATESPVSAGNDATYINTPNESERVASSMWSRWKRWLRGE